MAETPFDLWIKALSGAGASAPPLAEALADAPEFQKAMKTWEAWAKTLTGDGAALFRDLADPSRGFGPLGAQLSKLGAAKLPERLDATEEWAEMKAAIAAWGQVAAGALTRAQTRFAAAVSSRPDLWSRGGRAAADEWFAILDEELSATQRDPAYLAAQRRMIRAGAELRLKEHALFDAFAEQRGMPKRAEVDDLHARIRALEAQVASLTPKRRRK